MPKFAANLSLMFTEAPLEERFRLAAEAGFTAVEMLFPYAMAPDDLAAELRRNDLTLALFNLPPGDMDAGERGLAALPDRFDAFSAGVLKARDYIRATGARRVHMMAGLAPRDDAAAAASYRRALLHAADCLGPEGADILIEPINGRNMPGYFLNDFNYAADLIADLGLPNVKLQFDCYHRQILHGDVTTAFRSLLPIIGHVQVASVPSRNEPDAEELNYAYLFAQFDRLGYQGFVGAEYHPRGETGDGLDWFKPYRRR